MEGQFTIEAFIASATIEQLRDAIVQITREIMDRAAGDADDNAAAGEGVHCVFQPLPPTDDPKNWKHYVNAMKAILGPFSAHTDHCYYDPKESTLKLRFKSRDAFAGAREFLEATDYRLTTRE